MSKSQRAAIDREIKDEMLRITEKYELEFDTILVYVLNKELGLGKKRIKRLYHQFINNRLELRSFYADDNNSDSNIDIFAMKKMLEKKGIYLPQLFDEIAKERFDDVTKLNSNKTKRGVYNDG
jgi:hypothetical protein